MANGCAQIYILFTWGKAGSQWVKYRILCILRTITANVPMFMKCCFLKWYQPMWNIAQQVHLGGGENTAYFAYHSNSVVKYPCFWNDIFILRIPSYTSVNECILCIPRPTRHTSHTIYTCTTLVRYVCTRPIMFMKYYFLYCAYPYQPVWNMV